MLGRAQVREWTMEPHTVRHFNLPSDATRVRVYGSIAVCEYILENFPLFDQAFVF